ncbi:MAG: SRPBCC domain-containing protein [candidate division Zixibacteria bacterium]|nr:SRPBCC domain-containing protein [candidate division Zixibacteria bacterium]
MITINNKYLKISFLIGLFTVIFSGISFGVDEREQNMPKTEYYFVQLLGTRHDWPENMIPEETKVMEEHYVYLQKLVLDKKVFLAGPVHDPVFGMIILKADSLEEAKKIMDMEPSVFKGVHTYEMHPMHVSLLVENFSPERFVREPSDMMLTREIVVPASLEQVWRAWTTTGGVKTFFSSEAEVELTLGGKYEIYFVPSAPPGLRGSEGCRVLSYLPMKMLSFEWNAPPKFEMLRKVHTQVVLTFDEIDANSVKVTLSHHGWGKGDRWREVYDYFDSAWGYVLDNLKKRFVEGPLDWEE